MNYDDDLDELDRIWPLGKQLVVPEGGTVLVAGAYEGRYMDYVATRYNPRMVVGYEPQKDKAELARKRLGLRGHLRTIVIEEGIGVHTCMAAMTQRGTDGCQIAGWTEKEMVRLNGVDMVLDQLGQPVDLFICNMEGYEVPLMAYLLTTGRIWEIKSLAVQFHSNPPHTYSLELKTALEIFYSAPLYEDFPTWCYFKQPEDGKRSSDPRSVPTPPKGTAR